MTTTAPASAAPTTVSAGSAGSAGPGAPAAHEATDRAPGAQQPVAQPLVRIENLRVTFPHVGVTAVDGLSLELFPGRCVALVGESGSGKSVTSRSLVGLAGRGAHVEADVLRSGEQDLLTLRPREWRRLRGRDIGYVFQDALTSLDPLKRIEHEVGEALRVHTNLSRRERQARVTELLLGVGIPDPEHRRRQYPHQLSGGLRQRALIASALSADPPVLIADEPTTALDVTIQARILDLLADLKAQGRGLILVSHDLAVVGRLAEEILVLRQGEVVERGSAEQILTQPEHPYTRGLLAAVPSRGRRGHRLSTAVEPPAPSDAAPADAAPADAVPSAVVVAPRTVVEARGLVKTYPRPDGGVRTVLEDVSFTLEAGRTLGIVGESGSGKSTAAGIVMALTAADAGEVLLEGEPWSALPERRRRERRRRIQAIYQDPLGSFDPRHDVRGILLEALGAAGVPARERTARAVELLEQVGLGAEHLDRHPQELSGGQRQRVAIGRALATSPEVLVCDEPVSALDVTIQAQVLDLLAELQASRGLALLFISHDLGVVHHLAHDVLVMQEGRVVERGPIENVFHDPQHAYTRALLASIPQLPQAAHP